MRKLNDNHQVWYSDGHKNLSRTLKEMGEKSKDFEREGSFIVDASISQYTDTDTYKFYYTGILIVDRENRVS